MPTLTNVTTQDSYSDAATLRCPGTVRWILHARNAAILYQLGYGIAGLEWELDERPMPPGTLSRALRIDAIRVRSLAPGAPAQVMIDTVGAPA